MYHNSSKTSAKDWTGSALVSNTKAAVFKCIMASDCPRMPDKHEVATMVERNVVDDLSPVRLNVLHF
ncbi:hypothetical protein ON010_g11657 [Phytophthora cinnamomi]|nr:hypothetical protein ON010_g11657 [Phytophthora cinnamomi]